MSKAEERAKERYWLEPNNIETREKYAAYEEGYHQAEKDLELSWEDLATIEKLGDDFVKQNHTPMSDEEFYKEVLKRFKERKIIMEYKEKIINILTRKELTSEQERQLEKIFPELKESEGDKSKKWILEYLHDGLRKSDEQFKDHFKAAIAWLEKQGEIDKASYEIAEKEKQGFVSNGFIKCYADFQDFKKGETYWLEYLGNDNYNVRSDNLLGKTYHITPCQLYTIFKKQTWTEKQGEQKPTDKVEPKFKVGDWITDGEAIFHVIDYIEHVYQLVTQSGTSFHFSDVNVENKYHLWTIADTKDGDVLCDITNKNVLIFNEISDGWVKCLCSVHLEDSCCLNCTELYGREEQCSFAPATKEQRELLFQKMKEAGYTFDFEKKELKNIEQKPAWSDHDEYTLKGIVDEIEANKSNAPDYDLVTYDRFLNWLNSLKERITNN